MAKRKQDSLIRVCNEGDADALKNLLLDATLNVNKGEFTPLMICAFEDYQDCVEILLRDPRTKVELKFEDSGRAAVFGAVRNDSPACLKLFLEIGNVDVNHEDDSNMSLIQFASMDAKISCVEFLLTINDIDVNVEGYDGMTPLSDAIINEHPNIVSILLGDLRTDPNFTSSFGETPLMIASYHDQDESTELLLFDTLPSLVSNFSTWRKMVVTVFLCDNWTLPLFVWKFIFSFLRQQTNVNAQIPDHGDQNDELMEGFRPGATALWLAASNGSIKCVKSLLARHDINLSLRTLDGQSPLDVAKARGHNDIVTLLENFKISLLPPFC